METPNMDDLLEEIKKAGDDKEAVLAACKRHDDRIFYEDVKKLLAKLQDQKSKKLTLFYLGG